MFLIGAGPDAFFYVGKFGTKVQDANRVGIKVPYPENSDVKLPAYNGQTLILKLPNGIKSNEIGWLSVWCVKFSVNFGHLPFFMSSDDNPTNNSVDIDPNAAKGENGAENFFGSKLLIGLMLVYLLQQIIF